MSASQAESPATAASVNTRNNLTKAQLRVLNAIMSGASNEQIARVMRTQPQTIKNQIASIFKTYRVTSRTALIVATLKEDRIRWDHSRCVWFKEASNTH